MSASQINNSVMGEREILKQDIFLQVHTFVVRKICM